MAATARLEARITPELQGLLRRAAELEGRSLTDFVVSAVYAAAQESINKAGVMELSLRDQLQFANVLLDPPAPNAALQQAFAEYQQTVQTD